MCNVAACVVAVVVQVRDKEGVPSRVAEAFRAEVVVVPSLVAEVVRRPLDPVALLG